MLTMSQLESMTELTPPLLTAYLSTPSVERETQPLGPSYLRWLKREARIATSSAPQKEQQLVKQQVARVERFLRERTPREKSMVLLAGSGEWVVVPLDQPVENELHWGKPALSQLFWMLSADKPHCIVVVDRTGARFFRYRLGELTATDQMDFVIDISQWKKKDLGHVTGQNVEKTRGSQRDTHRHRVDAQYARLTRKVAERAVELCQKRNAFAIFFVGLDRLTLPIAEALPKNFHCTVYTIPEDVGHLSLPELETRLEPRIQECEDLRQQSMVENLVGDSGKAIVGLDETLALLQKGKIRTLVIARGLDENLRQCSDCGWIDRSADPVCPKCKRERFAANLRDVLPELAWKKRVQVEVIAGKAAEKLKEFGGMGGWLRGRTQAELR
jgi:hypothetical protein